MNSPKKKEWFSAFELEGIGNLPSKATNITRRATKENWEKRQIQGKKGIAYEYHYSSLPPAVQEKLGFRTKSIEQEPSLALTVAERLEVIDKIMAAVSTLEQKVKELEEPSLESLPDTLDNAEKRLIRWFRQCNKDRQAMLLSSAEVLAGMSLNEQKESVDLSQDRKVA